MNKEDLKKLGIEDEDLIQKVLIEHGKGIEKFKSDLAAKQQELDGVASQLTEASKQIESFKGMDIEGVKKSADDWKAKAEQAAHDAQSQVSKLKFDHALESALTSAKAKNPVTVRALLKETDLKLAEDGSIVGLTEQLERVKTENDYLFESEEANPQIVTGGNKNSITSDAVLEAARKAAGLPVNT